jgi:hypothetical protein
MKRTLLAAIAGLMLGAAAHAAPSYAVLSLVGDKLDIVTYQPTIGSQLDANSHALLAMPQDELDVAALRAINRSLKAAAPDAQVALLAASTAADFAGQDNIFGGDHVALPPEIDAALRREAASMLVLVTKHHGEARMKSFNDRLGSGRVEGLGFYLDGNKQIYNRDTGTTSVGYIAPFVYVDVALVDLASRTVVRHTTIEAGRVIEAAHNASGINAWDALTAAEKVAMLTQLLASELDSAVPALLSGKTASASADASTDPPAHQARRGRWLGKACGATCGHCTAAPLDSSHNSLARQRCAATRIRGAHAAPRKLTQIEGVAR